MLGCSKQPEQVQAKRYDVVITGNPDGRLINGIKGIREVTGLGLADAKALFEYLAKSRVQEIDPACSVIPGVAHRMLEFDVPILVAFFEQDTLIKRVYEFDPMTCPRCSGQMNVVAFLHPGNLTTTISDSRGPHLLAIDRSKQRNVVHSPTRLAGEISGRGSWIFCLQQVGQAVKSSGLKT